MLHIFIWQFNFGVTRPKGLLFSLPGPSGQGCPQKKNMKCCQCCSLVPKHLEYTLESQDLACQKAMMSACTKCK